MHIRAQLIVIPLWGAILAGSLYSCSSSPEKQGGDFGYEEEGQTAVSIAEPETPPPPKKPSVRIALRDDVPGRYVVKKGDTLWDIASLFLRDPWLWPEIWYFNPQINNPHLIYPGDILTLVYVDGQPQLRLTREDGTQIIEPSVPIGIPSEKLDPRIRAESLAQAIPTIPISVIEPFLSKPRVISKKELEQAPYIVSSLDQHLVSAAGNTVYARNLDYTDDVRYNIFRPGRVFKDPKTNEILGYETTLVSEAKLVKTGDPATMLIMRSIRETLNGDRILPADKGRVNYNFIPKPPTTDVEGQIIALIDAVSQTAQRQIVVINLGERQGIEVGTVLAIDQQGAVVRDPYAHGGTRSVKLPDHRAGLLMVFRVFERVSYGLIVDSTRVIRMYDMVRNPASSAEIISK
ncbi:MAG: LysM peptidoglycan-binding domain-containing protein [Gammaproteobacteria bacterium]|nr:LysM peptidoglycan-binding domain-containing protein [Gammaproteobacteria bacterium]